MSMAAIGFQERDRIKPTFPCLTVDLEGENIVSQGLFHFKGHLVGGCQLW